MKTARQDLGQFNKERKPGSEPLKEDKPSVEGARHDVLQAKALVDNKIFTDNRKSIEGTRARILRTADDIAKSRNNAPNSEDTETTDGVLYELAQSEGYKRDVQKIVNEKVAKLNEKKQLLKEESDRQKLVLDNLDKEKTAGIINNTLDERIRQASSALNKIRDSITDINLEIEEVKESVTKRATALAKAPKRTEQNTKETPTATKIETPETPQSLSTWQKFKKLFS